MKKIFDMTEKLLLYFASICLAVFSVSTFLQVVLRAFGTPAVWSEEIARFSFIYMVFTGCAVGVRKGTHYTFDIFGKMKNKLVSYTARTLALAFQLAFFGFLLYTAIVFIPQMAARASSVLRIPVSIPYSSIIVFAGFGIIFTLEKIVEFIRDPESYKENENYEELEGTAV